MTSVSTTSINKDLKGSLNPMPIWVDNNHIHPKWIQDVTGIPCSSCKAEDISNETRKSDEHVKDGATLRLTIVQENSSTNNDNPSANSTTCTLIVKQVPDQGLALSKQLGLAREALFYLHCAGKLPQDTIANMPKIVYSFGDFASGSKCVIMEDIRDAIDSGVLFGPGNPNNWKRNLPEIAARSGTPPPSSREVALITFREIAKIHATFWNDDDLLTPDKTWLRGQEWLQGKGRESWEASQQLVQTFWKGNLDTESDKPVITWDANVRSAVEKAIEGISWDAQLKRLNSEGHWTLVHGDFWPGNVMWMTNERNSIRFLDWEMVGLGSGPQDLGQYVISNFAPGERRQCERELVETYFDELKRHKSNIDCSWEYCWREYKVGGVERWLWFLVYFVGNGMAEWAQYFHDQIRAFMNDHELTADDIIQPRP